MVEAAFVLNWQFIQMGKPVLYVDGASAKNGLSLTDRLYSICTESLQFATPDPTLKTSEFELVQSVLQMLQGFSSPLFYWDSHSQSFCVKDGIYVAHLSQTSLGGILSQFLYSATCLQLVEHFAKKVGFSSRSPPTLEAFGNSVFVWLKRFRDLALNEEKRLASADQKIILTLLGLVNSLSSLFAGAEYLLQVVHGAVPTVYFESESLVSPSEMAVHILDYLYKKLDEVSPVQGGEEEAYHMILFLFVGSLMPCIEGLDSWLYDGTLDDPFEEMFFYANDTIAIDQPAFWEKSYLLRPQKHRKLGPGTSSLTCGGESKTDDNRDTCDVGTTLTSSSLRGKDQDRIDAVVCPLFIKDIAKAIVSAGKSLQLIRHATDNHSTILKGDDPEFCDFGADMPIFGFLSFLDLNGKMPVGNEQNLGRLSLPEIFFISLLGLIYDGCHVYKYLELDPSAPEIQAYKHQFQKVILEKESGPSVSALVDTEKIWCKFLFDTLSQGNNRRVNTEGEKANFVKSSDCSAETREAAKYCDSKWVTEYNAYDGASVTSRSFRSENPVISECRELICGNRARKFCLPSLNDHSLREAIFGGNYAMKTDVLGLKGTNYTFGFQFDEFEFVRQRDERETFGSLFPFSTLLPCFQEDITISEFLPFQKNSTLASRVLNWMLGSKPKGTPLPGVIVQECLVTYINKQVDYVGKHILLNLMNGWRLMDELGVLRAIYLLGSGDLLQHFLIVLFDKLDKGDPWDDEFELNDVLQESIRNSSDVMLLSASDSLVVCNTKSLVSDDGRNTTNPVIGPHKSRNNCFDIDTLDLLKFTYKVSWPLELIANMDAIKKYNQVMGFLLKVKRAKYVLDKARRWMWKDGSAQPVSRKRHLLVEQKLLHFVDAFHQYVMDRVFHSAWLELCEGMESAGSLDEVIEVHEAYLLSIQRLCFVAPDKLCSLIATRIKNILGLALDFYSIQQTLCSGAATPAIKANCENQVDWIEKQFNEYIIFLLRVLSSKPNVGHFPHLADLVTRINYNYFYMSDNGSLSTGTTSDTTAKIGKTFLTRADL